MVKVKFSRHPGCQVEILTILRLPQPPRRNWRAGLQSCQRNGEIWPELTSVGWRPLSFWQVPAAWADLRRSDVAPSLFAMYARTAKFGLRGCHEWRSVRKCQISVPIAISIGSIALQCAIESDCSRLRLGSSLVRPAWPQIFETEIEAARSPPGTTPCRTRRRPLIASLPAEQSDRVTKPEARSAMPDGSPDFAASRRSACKFGRDPQAEIRDPVVRHSVAFRVRVAGATAVARRQVEFEVPARRLSGPRFRFPAQPARSLPPKRPSHLPVDRVRPQRIR